MGVLTREVGDFVSLVSRAAAEQGGVISGDNPTKYLPTDPFRLWVIQVVIILSMAEFLHFFLRRIRQPRVIAEVIGGILLGPTVMMRIPGFKAAIFPTTAMPGLVLTSTVGLVIFLFLVGLEVDTKIIKRNYIAAASVSLSGLVVPLGLGAAVGVGIYRNLVSPDINFGYFVLFSAVAVGITAFPVLCRILTELKLLDTTVGVVTLGAGVGNDIVGWILLALAVALVNASTGLTALYILLACTGYVVFLLIPGRLGYVWLARRTGSLEQGAPTPFMMTITLGIVMASAFFTDIIGVHPIFGGFVAGLIIPHENGYAISMVERLEDLVNILFIPIYFTLSGLNTDLSALNTGTAWGFTAILCVVSFSAKFIPCFTAASLTGFNWREAGAIGSLMSCKGLVELIVLNVGLQAGILNTLTFSMFVVHALVLTVITTPLTLLFYPPKYRVKAETAKLGAEAATMPHLSSETETKTRFALILDRIEQLPAAMTICQLLQPDKSVATASSVSTMEIAEKADELSVASPLSQPRVAINALRLIELTSRTSAVLKSQLIYHDPVISVFRTFGYLNRLLVSAALSVVNYDEFSAAISNHVVDSNSQMVILPWSRGISSEDEQEKTGALNPFDGVFHKSTTHDPTNSVVYSEFIRKVFATSPSPVALYVDCGINSQTAIASNYHLFLPFFGGPDDRLALSFVMQLCSSPSVQATVFRIQKMDDLSPSSTNNEKGITPATPHHQTMAAADTVYGQPNTETRLASDTADNIIWSRFASSDSKDPKVVSALSRVRFDAASSSQPLHTIVELVKAEMSQSVSSKDMIVVTGRSRRMAVESHRAELQQLIAESGSPVGSSVSKTLGDVGAALVATSTNASLLVLQGGT